MLKSFSKRYKEILQWFRFDTAMPYQVSNIIAIDCSEQEVLQYATSLAQHSAMFSQQALITATHNLGLSLFPVQHYEDYAVSGVLGKINADTYAFGDLSFIKDRGIDISPLKTEINILEMSNVYLQALVRDTTLIGVLGLTEL